jgi:hypothetical protein
MGWHLFLLWSCLVVGNQIHVAIVYSWKHSGNFIKPSYSRYVIMAAERAIVQGAALLAAYVVLRLAQ